MNFGDFGDSMLKKLNYGSFHPGLELKFADFLINKIVDAAFCLGENAQFLYVNNATCDLTEYSREELLSMKLNDLDVDCSSHNWSAQWQHLTNLENLSFKSRYRTKEGRIFLAAINLTYIQYQDSEFCCGFIRENSNELVDLSVQKWIDEGREIKKSLQKESAKIQPQHIDTLLRLRESRFRTLLEATNASIFLLQGTQICYVNPAAELLTGYTKRELLAGFDFNQLIKTRKPKHREATNSEHQEINILTKDGTERWLDVAVTRFDGGIDFHGQEVEVFTAIDITDYKYAQLELRQTLKQAKEISELRANVVAMLCHQFRTPLNVISFSNSLLKRHIDRWKGEKSLLFLGHIQTAVEQVNQVLDDILFLAKTESSKVGFESKQINLVDLCQDLIAKILIANSGKYIDFHSRGNCLKVWIDQKLLEPILNNLLENAIKYSPIGSVVDLTVDCDQETITFQIKDEGIGIPEVDQQRLFEPFYRGSNVDKISGTGLGLSIVKTLVDLHGGQIKVVSEVGVGTTFTVVLPSVPSCDSEIA
ncbi:PAS domain S-box protein [Anabaena sphaerica FACHB-251]|uniref:histidine kinase n=2 Tax=Anabaena TaxID=1163 RepID=A0A926ZYE5_9NOST|nr:PAS domain-containing sensor histidine kinase [Anabaena sphaerica]MBD2291949.1 PAS domain S-box protein [Anabaena sphaerica FACHB-251]